MVQENWIRGKVLENAISKLFWDFKLNLRKTTTSGGPDLILEDKERRKILIYDVAFRQQANMTAKRREKLTKYRQNSLRRRLNYGIVIIPIAIGALG